MSDKRDIVPQSDKSNAVQLHDNGLRAGSLIENSVRNLSQEQVQALMAKAAEEALRLEVKNREQNLDYVAGKKVAEDHIDTFNMLQKDGKLTRQSVTSDFKTGAGNMRIESKSGATCFVATAVYGDPNHPEVVFLRWYRDNILSKNVLGKLFIKIYWIVGPKLAILAANLNLIQKFFLFCVKLLVRVLRKRYL